MRASGARQTLRALYVGEVHYCLCPTLFYRSGRCCSFVGRPYSHLPVAGARLPLPLRYLHYLTLLPVFIPGVPTLSPSGVLPPLTLYPCFTILFYLLDAVGCSSLDLQHAGLVTFWFACRWYAGIGLRERASFGTLA